LRIASRCSLRYLALVPGNIACGHALEENAAGGHVGIESEDVFRGHPCREELDFQSRIECRRECARVEAGDPGRHALHPVLVRLRDCRRHPTRAERWVANAAGPDPTVPADDDVAHGPSARPRLKEPRTLHGRDEVALVGIPATLPESTIETGRQVARPLGRDSCWSDLS